VPVASLAEMLGGLEDETGTRMLAPEGPSETVALSWRERLWTVPAETRLGVHELTQALGRPKSWIYRRTSAKADGRLPHRKLGGELLFTAGEIRAWLREHEEVIEAGPMESAAAERRLKAM
jgi:predicted DNA-binding transcriptional regulator AlpA